jgi:hypothetical protein
MTDKIAAQNTQSAAPAAAEGPKLAKIVTTKVMEKMVPLEYPVEFDGKLHEAVRVHRVTGTEIKEYVEKLGTPDASPFPPSIDIPVAVWTAMDADDTESVLEASLDFLPRRMRTDIDPT